MRAAVVQSARATLGPVTRIGTSYWSGVLVGAQRLAPAPIRRLTTLWPPSSALCEQPQARLCMGRPGMGPLDRAWPPDWRTASRLTRSAWRRRRSTRHRHLTSCLYAYIDHASWTFTAC